MSAGLTVFSGHLKKKGSVVKRWHLSRWAPTFPFRGMIKLSENTNVMRNITNLIVVDFLKMCLALLIENW